MKVQVNSDLLLKVKERFIQLQLAESPTSELFLRTLIERRIISFDTMRNYIIVKDFDLFLKTNKGNILHSLEDFEEDYKVSTRWIRKIHKKYTRVF